MKKFSHKILQILLTKKAQNESAFLGPRKYLTYFFFQRIIGINRHVPWPVHHSSVVTNPQNIKKKSTLPYLGHHVACYIQAMNGIEIGSNVRYGPNVHIISANHDLLDYDIHTKADPIRIEDNCWIGAGAIILSGVHLSEHTVVAAGSVVTKSFPKNVLIGGIPAEVIKELGDYQGSSQWGPQ